MKRTIILLATGFFFLSASSLFAKEDYLAQCWKKQGQSLHEKYLTLSYRESINRLYHSMVPWQTYRSAPFGQLWINSDRFLKHDTIQGKREKFASLTQFDPSALLSMDFGDTSFSLVTQRDVIEYTFESARYSPVILIHYFLQHKIQPDKESNQSFAVYNTTIGKTIVRLFIRRGNFLISKITMLSHDDIYGDVVNSFLYDNYSSENNINFAKTVYIEKMNGMVHDTLTISSAAIISEGVRFLKTPANFSIKADEKETSDTVTLSKFSDHIHFVTFKHADSKAMIVEFGNFLVIAESPLTSANGELLIDAAREIAPQKPIKYFTYGHWHPWYLGGVRPFIHKGVTIVCPECDSVYVPYLSNAKHSLEPDSLQLQPRALHTEVLRDSMTISDGKYSMTIYQIGKKSDHTLDYSIFYFPLEKMVFEGDLAWIKKDAAAAKASSRQAGLYNSIKERNLDVATIVQAWPVTKYGLKSAFDIADLENAMKVK